MTKMEHFTQRGNLRSVSALREERETYRFVASIVIRLFMITATTIHSCHALTTFPSKQGNGAGTSSANQRARPHGRSRSSSSSYSLLTTSSPPLGASDSTTVLCSLPRAGSQRYRFQRENQLAPQKPQSGHSSPSSSSSFSRLSTMLHQAWPLTRDPVGVSPDFPMPFYRVAVTTLSTFFTWYLHYVNGFSSVLSSSVITLLLSMCIDRRFGQAAFCGTFAGMCGGHIVPDASVAMALGLLTSLLYEVIIHSQNACIGIGGRLGATAFIGSSLLANYRGISTGATWSSNTLRKVRQAIMKINITSLWKGNRSGDSLSMILATMIVWHAIGAAATIALREASDDSAAADPVRASAVVGLIGSLFLKDNLAALALYGGSFVGMSLPSRLMYGVIPGRHREGQRLVYPQTPLLLVASFGAAGALAGLIHGLTIHLGYWNGGWGGKAGLCAFAGCLVYRGIGNTIEFFKLREKKKN